MLELKDICFTPADSEAGASKEILKNINLTIDERFVAITGPNGSGKSTLAKIIAERTGCDISAVKPDYGESKCRDQLCFSAAGPL